MLTGDGDRDPLRAEDYSFSTRSRSTYAAALDHRRLEGAAASGGEGLREIS